MTRRRVVADAAAYRPAWTSTAVFSDGGVAFPPSGRRKRLLRWLANPEQTRFEFGPEGDALRAMLRGEVDDGPILYLTHEYPDGAASDGQHGWSEPSAEQLGLFD